MKSTTTTPPVTMEAQAALMLADQFMKTNGRLLVYLRDRWAEEREYETFDGYEDHMRRNLVVDPALTIEGFRSSPFTIRLKFTELVSIQITVGLRLMRSRLIMKGGR